MIGLWFGLAQDVVATLPLGWSLAPLLGVLLGGVFYTRVCAVCRSAGVADACVGFACFPARKSRRGRLRSKRRLRNVLGAGVVAAFVIALWYLTNIEFLNYFLFTAYGREEEPFYAFGKYLGEVVNEQLGPWFALVFVVVVVVWAWQAWRRRRQGVAAARWQTAAPGGRRTAGGVQSTQENWLRLSDIGVGAAAVGGGAVFCVFISGDAGAFALCDAVPAALCDLDGGGADAVAPACAALECHRRRAAAGYFAICSHLV